ncbi:MAG: HesA/MoeB/ThiF family protein [Candidatus Bipolaricaulaceae bacterium]
MDARFSRQVRLPQIGEAGQRALGRARVLVAGCGALGSHTAVALLRAGVRRLALVDRDLVEVSNLHRVALFTPRDVGHPKADRLAHHLRKVDPGAQVEAHVTHLSPRNAEQLATGVDLVVDGLDNLESRYLVNDVCVKHHLPWVYTAVLATYGMTMPIVPGAGPCLRCLFPQPPPPGALPTCATAGILGPLPMAMAALQSASALQLLLASRELRPGQLVHVDLWARKFAEVEVARAVNCPACRGGQFDSLASPPRSAAMCGDAVQIIPASPGQVNLDALARRLAPLGRVRRRGEVVVAELSEVSLTVFSDGRALVKGITDLQRAQALYDQYVAR